MLFILPDIPVDPALKRAQSLVGTSAGRPADDWYPTPPAATEALLRCERFEGTILEPACGDGAISKILIAHGYTVTSTDLINRGYGTGGLNFFQSDHRAANICTNPPYKLAEQFIRLSLAKTTGKVAMLLKLQFLEGQKRKALFASTPLQYVYVFSKRLSLTRNGQAMEHGGMLCFCWMVWNHAYSGEPILRWI